MSDSDAQVEGPAGHRPVIPPVIGPPAPRVAKSLLEHLSHVHLPDLSDAVGSLYTVDAGLRPLYTPMRRMVGQALTIKAPPGDNLTIHGAITMVEPHDVLVVDWRGHVGSCGTGAHSLAIPISQGLAGVVVDGGWRDIGQLRELDFPIFGRGVSAYSPPKDRPGEINVTVSCGGVVVEPGDVVVGDPEGIVVIPARWVEKVAASVAVYDSEADRASLTEEKLRAAMRRRERHFAEVVADYGGDATGLNRYA